MKATEKDKPVRTIPDGVWEGGLINEEKKASKSKHLNEISTDAQGNGYPITDSNQKK